MGNTSFILSQIRDKEPPPSLPKLCAKDYSLLWESDYWDGPLCGILSHGRHERWFEVIQENQDAGPAGRWFRRYAVVVLTPEQLAREHEIFADLNRYVRKDEPGIKSDEHRPRDQWQFFYDKHLAYCRSRNFDDCEVLAWFEI